MLWKAGPMPMGTWNWGGVVALHPEKHGMYGGGFYFADFHGNHAMAIVGNKPIRLEAEEIAFYNNSLDLPPKVPAGSKRLS